MIRDNARKVFLESVIQIGTRLEEAKQLVAQGEWTAYLTDKLGYKPSTAQNYMRIAREFGGGQVSLTGKTAADAFGQLSYSQILPLLGMAEEEREELAEEHDLPSMSSREIAALVKERDEARRKRKRRCAKTMPRRRHCPLPRRTVARLCANGMKLCEMPRMPRNGRTNCRNSLMRSRTSLRKCGN